MSICGSPFFDTLISGDTMKKIDINIPEYITDIIVRLQNAGFEAYVVGGCVRDTLLGISANDWDVCTSALPSTVKGVLTGYNVIETGIQHGTVTAVKNSRICEITTFRSDGEYTDHRRPDSVSFTSDIKADLSRRDFTVNSMAYSPTTGLVDLFGGQADLNSKILRCVGDAKKRFDEDALRIIRALRFSACLGFKIEKETKEAILSCCDLTEYVARERIINELKRLICGDFAAEVICEFIAVFEKLFKLNISEANVKKLKNAPQDVSTRLALLLCDTDDKDVYFVLKNLKSDNKTIENVCFLLKNKDMALEDDVVSIRKMLSDFGKERALLLAEFVFTAKRYTHFRIEKIRNGIKSTPAITLSTLELNGSDIMALGVPPGKEIKELLKSALDAVVCEKCPNEKAQLIKYISKLI